MTIDFLKIKVTDAGARMHFRHHHLLYFHSESEILLFDMETITSKTVLQYKGILFEFTKHALYIYFKPHYYFNGNLHNANDFSVLNCIKTLQQFIFIFQVDSKYLEIINIEFALNIIIPKKLICVKDLLAYLIYHQQNEFHTDRRYTYCRFSHSTNSGGKANVYKILKAYAKGIQFPEYTDINTFRFEVKSNRKRYLHGLGIFTLQDLLNIRIYNVLGKTILDEFDEVLIIDDKAKPKLSSTRLRNYEKKLNPIYWRKLLNKSKNTFRRNLNAYNSALDTCDTHLKMELRKLIFDKLMELKRCAVLSIYIDETSTPFYKPCLLTGINISMQKDDSILLSHTGLKYYYETDPNTYKKIKNKYLSTIWVNSTIDTEIKEIAHNIRNYHSNLKIRQQRLYPKHQHQLVF